MTKTRTTITISKDLLKQAREKEINISSFVDIELRRYLALIEGKQCSEDELRRGGDLNSCGAKAPRAFQARAVPV